MKPFCSAAPRHIFTKDIQSRGRWSKRDEAVASSAKLSAIVWVSKSTEPQHGHSRGLSRPRFSIGAYGTNKGRSSPPLTNPRRERGMCRMVKSEGIQYRLRKNSVVCRRRRVGMAPDTYRAWTAPPPPSLTINESAVSLPISENSWHPLEHVLIRAARAAHTYNLHALLFATAARGQNRRHPAGIPFFPSEEL